MATLLPEAKRQGLVKVKDRAVLHKFQPVIIDLQYSFTLMLSETSVSSMLSSSQYWPLFSNPTHNAPF
jgi:hypothetical protein